MSLRIAGIVRAVVVELHARELVVLAPGASPEALADEVLAAMQTAPAFAAAGPFIAGVLLRSPLVEELYAEDRDITGILNDLGS